MKIEKFEDIVAWQEARKLVNMIYKSTNSSHFIKDIRLKSQLTSSSVSVMSNIAEGFNRNSNKEFIRYLFITKASLAELQSQLYVAEDQKYISKEDFKTIYNQAEYTAKLTSKFITYLKLNTYSLKPKNSNNTTNSTNPTNSNNSNNSTNSTNSINPKEL